MPFHRRTTLPPLSALLALPLSALLALPSGAPQAAFAQDSLTRPFGLGIAPMLCRTELSAGARIGGLGKDARLQAHYQAIEAWRALVSQRDGEAYAHWWKASQKTVDCRTDRGATICKVAATPCGSRSY